MDIFSDMLFLAILLLPISVLIVFSCAVVSCTVGMQVPAEHFANFLAWLVMSAVLVAIVLTETSTMASIALALSILFSALIGLLIGAVIATALRSVEFAAKLWRRGSRGPTPQRIEYGGAPSPVTALQMACAGVVVAFLLNSLLRSLLQGFRPAWAAHVIVAAIAAIAWVTLVSARRTYASERLTRWQSYLRSFRVGFSRSLLLLLFLQVAYGCYVAYRAAAVAGDDPYCIQTADRHAEYVPAESLLDLSALTMRPPYHSRGRGLGSYGGYHAVLVVGDANHLRVLNWSYRSGDFVDERRFPDDPPGGLLIYCSPEHDFSARLHMLFGRPAGDSVHVRIGGRRLTIPTAYQPTIRGSGPYVIIAALSPEFRPIDEPVRPGMDSTWFDKVIWMHFAPEGRLDSYARPSAGDAIEPLTDEFGLSRRRHRWGGSLEQIEYYARDRDGRVTTLVGCAPPQSGSDGCQHRFLRDGVLFEFKHPVADMKSWPELQQRLVNLLDSWTAPGTARNWRDRLQDSSAAPGRKGHYRFSTPLGLPKANQHVH